jgi:hypothetical protein
LAFINFDEVLDSYKDYLKLFYLIASYQAELKIGANNDMQRIEKDYVELAAKLEFKRFDLRLLKNYFD